MKKAVVLLGSLIFVLLVVSLSSEKICATYKSSCSAEVTPTITIPLPSLEESVTPTEECNTYWVAKGYPCVEQTLTPVVSPTILVNTVTSTPGPTSTPTPGPTATPGPGPTATPGPAIVPQSAPATGRAE